MTKQVSSHFHRSSYFGAEVGRATFTADPSRAVHQDLLIPEKFQVLVHIVWEVAEFSNVWSQTLSKLSLQGKLSEY